jgi:hypothetical protein
MNFLKSRRCFQRAEGYSELPGIPIALSITLVVMCILLSFLLTRSALLRSRHAYRSPDLSLFSKPF